MARLFQKKNRHLWRQACVPRGSLAKEGRLRLKTWQPTRLPLQQRALPTLLCWTQMNCGRRSSVKFVAKEGILPQKAFGVLSGEVKSAELFKDDPLIQEAIEIFKAQIKS